MAVTKTKKLYNCKCSPKYKIHNRKNEKEIWLKWSRNIDPERQERKIWVTVWKICMKCKEEETCSGVSPSLPLRKSSVISLLSNSVSQISVHQIFDENIIDLCNQFAVIGNYGESYDFLNRHPFLVSEATAEYLIQSCTSLNIATDLTLIERIAHQVVTIKYILQWEGQFELDKDGSIKYFFAVINRCTELFREQFRITIDELIITIMRLQQERSLLLGPNGSDPFEILDMLPIGLKYAFMLQDVSMLCKALNKLDPEEALKHMRYCIYAGLWVTKHDTGNEFDSLPSSEDELPRRRKHESHFILQGEARQSDLDISKSPILSAYYCN